MSNSWVSNQVANALTAPQVHLRLEGPSPGEIKHAARMLFVMDTEKRNEKIREYVDRSERHPEVRSFVLAILRELDSMIDKEIK